MKIIHQITQICRYETNDGVLIGRCVFFAEVETHEQESGNRRRGQKL